MDELAFEPKNGTGADGFLDKRRWHRQSRHRPGSSNGSREAIGLAEEPEIGAEVVWPQRQPARRLRPIEGGKVLLGDFQPGFLRKPVGMWQSKKGWIQQRQQLAFARRFAFHQ